MKIKRIVIVIIIAIKNIYLNNLDRVHGYLMIFGLYRILAKRKYYKNGNVKTYCNYAR